MRLPRPVILGSLVASAFAQQFEIPAEMLQGMMGGMMGGGGGGQQVQRTEWPKSENSEIEPEYEFLINTEWKGKTAKYMFVRGGIIESSLKECEHEGQCLWAANSDKIIINTPTLKVIKFTIEGLKQADRKKLAEKDEPELKKLKLQAEKAGKSGKKSILEFSKLQTADEQESILGMDLYEVMDLAEDADQASIKSKFRRLSVVNHPDKGGDPAKFAELREAYEVLGDAENRRYYGLGGMQLVKNIELGYKEAEGQKAQMDAQLQGVPKNHPQYQMMKMQIDQQKKQFDKSTFKHELEKKFKSDDLDVKVPISAAELYNGVSNKSFEFKRLVICRGCREDPTLEKCKDCGRCRPEIVQVPKYANTPFGKQVVAVKEKEQESRERCREVLVPVTGLRVPKGAKAGSTLKYVSDSGHQTPGKLPGKVVLKVEHGSQEDLYTIAEADLHTVLTISLEEALFGFTYIFNHLGDEKVTITRSRVTSPDEVVRLKKKGLVSDGGARGDLYVRIAVEFPEGSKSQTMTLSAPSSNTGTAKLSREADIEIREGAAWRHWIGRENPTRAQEKSKEDKSEL